MMIRGQFSDFFFETQLPAIRSMAKSRLRRKPKQFNKIFHTMDSDRSIEQFSGVSGMGYAAEINEEGDVGYDSIVQEFDSLFKHRKYGLAARYSKELFDDDRFGIIESRTSALSDSINETVEVQAFTILNFSTTANPFGFTSPDGVSLVSQSHPLAKAGGVQANRPAIGAALTHSSLEIELVNWELTKKSNNHDALLPTPNLVVHSSNRYNSKVILASTGRSDTTNNAVNALRTAGENGGAAVNDIIITPKLADPLTWFLIEPPSSSSGLLWIWRKKPYSQSWVDEGSEVAHYALRYRASFGYRWWEGIRQSGPNLP